jgi:cytochrome P450
MSTATLPSWIGEVTPAALDVDPYPWYARMRAEAPVVFIPWAEVHFVTRWEHCHRVGNDTEAFRGAEHHRTVNRVFGAPNILTSVDPVHRDLRNAVDPHLRPRQVNTYIEDLARPLARAAVAEGMRWIAPIGSVEREATCHVRVGGVELQPGDLVEVVMASANRDERRFERPDEFDIDRPRQEGHMAFGNGEHLCSGHYFSRQLERIMLEELLGALPALRLDDEHEPVVRGWNFRAPKELHVCWDAA